MVSCTGVKSVRGVKHFYNVSCDGNKLVAKYADAKSGKITKTKQLKLCRTPKECESECRKAKMPTGYRKDSSIKNFGTALIVANGKLNKGKSVTARISRKSRGYAATAAGGSASSGVEGFAEVTGSDGFARRRGSRRSRRSRRSRASGYATKKKSRRSRRSRRSRGYSVDATAAAAEGGADGFARRRGSRRSRRSRASGYAKKKSRRSRRSRRSRASGYAKKKSRRSRRSRRSRASGYAKKKKSRRSRRSRRSRASGYAKKKKSRRSRGSRRSRR